ncbi:unannotated protein [freshwater metagenome]|uniref:Unannotated protein n=1 Tax=freshwater metagenome TaxID=449393 RepID=A0A6J7S562_9ZZZZ
MLECLLRRQLPLPHHLLNKRVIIGQPLKRSATPAIAATITDVNERDVALADVGGGDRRSHPGTFLVGDREGVDLRIGLLNGLAEPLLETSVVPDSSRKYFDRGS